MDLDDKEDKMLKELVLYKVLAPTPDEIINEIVRLKEENENLKDYLKIMEKGKDNNLNRFLDYKSRIDKAREYCRLNKEFTPRLVDIENILNGGDE